jgi:deazaflavin-dependent oxidoreductase (nitroreductase family)
MPLPRALARLNRAVINRITRPFAAWLPGFAVLHHTGRLTGARYSTPVNAFRRDGEIVVPLTYGADVDWLRNARARPPSILVMRGEPIEVGRPDKIPTAEGLAAIPALVGTALQVLDVTGFVAFPIDPSVSK